MQHDDVMESLVHTICPKTGYCRVCGMHRQMIAENGYACRFSLNLVPISHLRAAAIKRERADRVKAVLDDPGAWAKLKASHIPLGAPDGE